MLYSITTETTEKKYPCTLCTYHATVLKRIFEYIRIFEYFLPNIDIRIQFVDIFRIRILFEYLNILVRIFRNYLMKQGQRQLGLDFIWDNGQLTWINKQLGSTIDQDKKIHWD